MAIPEPVKDYILALREKGLSYKLIAERAEVSHRQAWEVCNPEKAEAARKDQNIKDVGFKSAAAFIDCQKRSIKSTKVRVDEGVAKMYEHDRLIAVYDPEIGEIQLSFGGLPSTSVKNRLNAILLAIGDERVFNTKDYKGYFDGKELGPEEWVYISEDEG